MTGRQHSIDLMPDTLHARAQAGVRFGQFIAIAVVSATLTIVAVTHSHHALSGAQEQLFASASQAEQVFATEAQLAELRHELESLRSYATQYRRLALPVNVGDVIATVVNLLPESVTLDQMDVNAGSRMINLGPRSRGNSATSGLRADSVPPRVLTAELSGFAASDQHIAELVSRLESTPPFEHVSLDFSRSRRVHDNDAREFRVSLRIDLDRMYRVMHAGIADAAQEGSP